MCFVLFSKLAIVHSQLLMIIDGDIGDITDDGYNA